VTRSPIRAVVVDDSATMRALISAQLNADPEIEVVGQAADPLQAREVIKQLNPDVITLDVEMPNMNGLDFLERLMRLRPMPVVMVSTLTVRGAEATLEALELGAVDCVAKPVSGGAAAFERLAEVVKAAAHARVRHRSAGGPPVQASVANYAPDGKVVAIGSSTGGVEALMSIIERLPANCPPTLITQHMPGTFTASFAERMNRACKAEVHEARDGAVLAAGKVYLAPGGENHLRIGGKGPFHCRVGQAALVNGHRPSVDVLFESVSQVAQSRAVGVILTGMGRDGAQGLLQMRRAGAHTLGQDDATCVVYGMPKAAYEIGAVERQLPIEQIGAAILSLTNRLERR
jgi:two-component system chemotaxis response regulator CheB